jgi:hypothetical protein
LLRAVLRISACAFVALATPAGELAVERIDVSVVCSWSLDLAVILVFFEDLF